MRIGTDMARKRKPQPVIVEPPLVLGPKQLLWCRLNIRNFADAEGHVMASEEYARKVKEKIGEPNR